MNSRTVIVIEPALRNMLQPWVGGLLVILGTSIFRKDAAKKRDDFVTAMGFVAFSVLACPLHWFLSAHLGSLDSQFWTLDTAFLNWSPLALYGFLARHPFLFRSFKLLYDGMPLVMAVAWVTDRDHAMRTSILLGGMFCWPFYLTFPASGPIYFVSGVALHAFRNCMPSMHLSWALMMAVNARSWARIPLFVYVVAMVIATLGLGEHYLIDLVAALPYTFAIQYAVTTFTQRTRSCSLPALEGTFASDRTAAQGSAGI